MAVIKEIVVGFRVLHWVNFLFFCGQVKGSEITYCLSCNSEGSRAGYDVDYAENHVCEVVRDDSRNHQEKDARGYDTLLGRADRKRRGRASRPTSACAQATQAFIESYLPSSHRKAGLTKE